MFFFVFFSLFVIGTSLAGLYYSQELRESVKSLRCSVLASGQDVLFDNYWVGLKGLRKRLANANKDLSFFVD